MGQQDQGVIRGFVEQLNLSNEALKLFAETAGQAVSIQSENVKLERQMAQNRVDLMRTSPEFGAFDRTLRDLEKERASDQGRVLGDKSLDGRARMEALMGALGSTSGKAKSELDRLNTYRDQLIGEEKTLSRSTRHSPRSRASSIRSRRTPPRNCASWSTRSSPRRCSWRRPSAGPTTPRLRR
ncbi:hypothetical protein ACFQWF_01220 [Methylorubrum suomiense]